MWLSRVRRETGICCARRSIRQKKVMNPAFPTLVFGFIAAAAAGCNAATPSPGFNSHQPRSDNAGAYASSSCFYSNDFGAERTDAGHILRWCGSEPRAVN